MESDLKGYKVILLCSITSKRLWLDLQYLRKGNKIPFTNAFNLSYRKLVEQYLDLVHMVG